MDKKIFVAFDGAEDLEVFNKLSQFKDSEGNNYIFYNCYDLKKKIDKEPDDNIKEGIYKLIDESDLAVIIISKKTKSMRKFISWQVMYLRNSDHPTICLNLTPIRSVDFSLIPAKLKRGNLSLHIPMEEKVFELAVKNWPDMNKKFVQKKKKGNFRFPLTIYENLYGVSEEE